LSPVELLTRAPSSCPAWVDLVLGAPVPEVTSPVTLRPTRDDDAGTLRSRLTGSPRRPLLEVTAVVGPDGLDHLCVVRFPGDLLAHAFDSVLRPPPNGLVPAPATEGAPPERARRSTIVRFVVDAVDARNSGSEQADPVASLLRGARVRSLLTALRADPADAGARTALAETLGQGGRCVTVGEVRLDAADPGSEHVVDVLDGLVVVGEREDPAGAVVVPPSRAASRLLRSQPRLASAVAGHVLAADDEGGDEDGEEEGPVAKELRVALAEAAEAEGAGRKGR
jgi:hypothetical protein